MLPLVDPDRDDVGLVEQDVARLQHGIREESRRHEPLRLGLLLELRHAAELAEARHRREQPIGLGVGRHVALREDRRAIRVEPGRDQHREQVERALAEVRRVVLDADRVEVDDAEEGLALLLRLGVLTEAARVVAEVLRARGLDAGEDAHREIVPGPAEPRRSNSRLASHAHRARPRSRRTRRRARRQVHLAPRRPHRRRLRGGDAHLGLRSLGGHGGDDLGRPCARSRGGRGRRRHSSRPRRRSPRAACAGRGDRLPQRGHAHATPHRARRRTGGQVRARRRRVALVAADGAHSRAATANGGFGRDDRRPCAARRRGRPPARDRLRASGRIGAGEIGDPARRDPGQRTNDRRRADRDAGSHRASPRAGGSARHTTAEQRHGRARGGADGFPRSRSRATSRRRRRFSSPPRSCPARRSPSTESGSIHAERGSSTCSSAWAHESRSTTVARSEASRRATSRCARRISSVRRSRRTRCRRSSTSSRSSPWPRVTRAATRSCAAQGSCARRSRTGSKRSSRSCAAWAGTSARRTTASWCRGVPARLRGGVVDARGDHRLAMLGAVVGVASREGVELRDAEAAAVSFPGFFEVLDQVAPGSVHYPPAT